jgi:cyclic-di-GMP phosphodiesterase TipF (flagellum assembly factor)
MAPMSLFTHAFIATFYLGVAALLGIGLPQVVPSLDPSVGVAIGALIALCGLFVHHVYIRSDNDQSVHEELARIRRSHAEVMAELETSLTQMRRLDEELAELKTKSAASPDMVAEMKVLQTLLKQLSTTGGRTRAATPDAAPGGADATAPAPTETAQGSRRAWAPPPTFAGASEAEVLDAIREAVASNRIDIYLQPVVRLPQRKVVYYEALSRLRSADGRLIEPQIYLDPAERNGLIGAIDNSLLFRCVQLLRRTEKRRPDLAFFCNVSSHTLADTTFFPQFVEFLEQNAQLSDRLVLEFPCDAFLAHDPATERALGSLIEFGYRFSVDHVTTLELPGRILARRGVAFVKLDAAAMLDRLRQPGGSAEARRLRTTLGVAGVNLIVEKIEQENDVIELLDLPVELGQGFRFGEPRLAREAA